MRTPFSGWSDIVPGQIHLSAPDNALVDNGRFRDIELSDVFAEETNMDRGEVAKEKASLGPLLDTSPSSSTLHGIQGVHDGNASSECLLPPPFFDSINHSGLIEGQFTLEDFIRRIEADNSQGIGNLAITEVQFRQSKRLTFCHDYTVVFVRQRGVTWAIRLERAGKFELLSFNKYWLPHLESAAKDLVTVVRYDSPDARAIIEDTRSKGSVLRSSKTYWTQSLHEDVDAALLLACWGPSAKRFQHRLNEVFEPCYDELERRAPAQLISGLLAAADYGADRVGWVYVSPKTLVFLVVVLSSKEPVDASGKGFFYRLGQKIKPPAVAPEVVEWAKKRFAELTQEYHLDGITLYNRLAQDKFFQRRVVPDDRQTPSTPDSHNEMPGGASSAFQSLNASELAYPPCTLPSFLHSLVTLDTVWRPYHSLFTSKSQLFARAVSEQNTWKGYMTPKHGEVVMVQPKLKGGVYYGILVFTGMLVTLLAGIVAYGLIKVNTGRAPPPENHPLALAKLLGIFLLNVLGITSNVYNWLTGIQNQAELRVQSLLQSHLPRPIMDLNWARPGVMLRMEEQKRWEKRVKETRVRRGSLSVPVSKLEDKGEESTERELYEGLGSTSYRVRYPRWENPSGKDTPERIALLRRRRRCSLSIIEGTVFNSQTSSGQ